MPKNVGFISTRFAGQDGVSLESSKWAQVLWDDRHVSHWYSGKSDRDRGVSYCVPEAYFNHPEVKWINQRIWGSTRRSRQVTERIRAMSDYLKSTIYDFVERYEIDILIPQNVLAIPMHVPLGMALTEFLAETQVPAIAHHHDFYWERTRFSVGSIQEFLDMAFPARLPNIRHAVINQAAQEQLSLRKGVSSLLIPNVFDFDNEPSGPDDYAADFREAIGLGPEDYLVLQPTRVVPRKGIENAIKLIAGLEDPRYKLVVTHESGDEGFEYQHRLEELAAEEGVDVRFVHERIGEVRQKDSKGEKVYTLWDAYPHADLVTYPSLYEGFGNALLESIYFRIPTVVNRYAIYVQDIEPKGFALLEMDGFVTQGLIRQVKKVMEDPSYRQRMVDHNFRTARRFYSYAVLRRLLRTMITSLTGFAP
ncbi:MAG: glycosyltransferase [Puniceicoccaceae bacterium]